MAGNRNSQFNNELERERFSNFVVDLRPLRSGEAGSSERPRVEPVKDKKEKIAFKACLRRVSAVFKNIRLNLAASEKKISFSLRSRRQLALPLARRSKSWSKFVREKERILNSYLIFGRRQSASRIDTFFNRHRQYFYFSFVLLFIIFLFQILSYQKLLDWRNWQKAIISRSNLAVNNLMTATDSVAELDFRGAGSEFQAAGTDFLAAQEDLSKISDSILSLASLSKNPEMKLAAESKKILAAGAAASALGRNLVLAMDSLFQGNKTDFSSSLDNFLNYGHQAVAGAQDLKKEIARININNLPEAYRVKFGTLSKQSISLADNLENFVVTGGKLKEFFGLSRDKRYLLVFQNNAELRASGGFLGSYALVDFRDGKIRNLEVPGGGSYDTEAGLKEKIIAPQPLWLVNPLWHFWDANWWPDWPTTAQNLIWFYEHSSGPSVDGVISVTPTVVERLLEITGPIDLRTEYGLIIDSNNFWETVQSITEQKNLEKAGATLHLPTGSTAPIKTIIPLKQGLDINAANKPKKIIGDLLAKILETLPTKLNKENLLKIIMLFEENMSEKQILFYFKDPILQAGVASHNWAGEVRKTNKDYLMVINTNIAGQKSDRLMSEKIEYSSEVVGDGSIINTLKIIRAHNGRKNEPLTGVRNVDWLRVYVPLGSELLSAQGFKAPDSQYLQERPEASWENSPLLANELAAVFDAESGTKIYFEKDKTVFANWAMVDPGETKTITLIYRLPFNFFSTSSNSSWLQRFNDWLNPNAESLWSHSLLVQKQPGAKASEFSGRLAIPAGVEIVWRYPENLAGEAGSPRVAGEAGSPRVAGEAGWDISENINSDKYWSILVKRQNK